MTKENKSILVVDDDEVARETICNSLEDTSYEIDTANDGHEALEKIAKKYSIPSLPIPVKLSGVCGRCPL